MEVALAAIALAGTTVGALVWVLKFFANTLSKDLKEHTEAALKQAEASNEVLTFMKNLNGKLEKAYVSKVKENQKDK
jgi:hypothetical protein